MNGAQSWGTDLGTDFWLSVELAEVVVQVFVHQDRPLVGGHAAEEAMGMGGAACVAAGDEAVDEVA